MTLEQGKRAENVEDGSLRTIECLRGRLVAERQASRAAEENAQLIANKLKELEEKLKEETKLRDKATKKLKFLERKLKSKKNSSRSKESEESSVSETESSTVSRKSSTTTTVTSRSKPDQDQEQIHETSVVSKCDVSMVTELKTSYDIFCSSSEKCGSELDGCKSNEQQHSAVVPVMENEEEEDYVDNSLALVPVTVPEEPESQTKELKIISRNVSEVLESLRRAREGIQKNIRQNDMMKLRPRQAQIC